MGELDRVSIINADAIHCICQFLIVKGNWKNEKLPVLVL
jgi:hypothetical protein